MVSKHERFSTPLLPIMFLPSNLPARLVLLVVQIRAFGSCEFAIGFVGAFKLTNVALLFSQVLGFPPRELACLHAVSNARVLINLPRVYTGIASALRKRSTCRKRNEGSKHEHRLHIVLLEHEPCGFVASMEQSTQRSDNG